MSARHLCLSAVSAVALAACATSQENPNYQYSTKYKASSPYADANANTSATQTQAAAPISYQSSTYQSPQYQTVSTASGYTQVDTRCLKSEQNRELIGGAVGGTVGAIAGKKFIGGTKGTVIGAVAGGAAGYGIGDKSINCDPIMVPASQTTTAQPPNYAPVQTQTYQTQPSSNQSYQTPAQYNPQYVAAPQQGQQTYTAPTDQAYGATVGTPGYDAIMGAQSQPVIPTQPQPVYTQAQPQQPVYLNPQPIYVQPQSVYLPGAPVTGSVTNTSVPVPQGQNGIPGISRHQVSEGDTVYSMARHLCVGVDDIRNLNGLDANYNIQLGQYIQLPTSQCR